MKVRATEEVVLGLTDGTTVVVRPGDEYDTKSEVVKQHAWAFDRSETPTR